MSDKKTILRSNAETSLRDWHKKEKTALELLQIVGDLRFDRSIELILFRRNIYDARPSEVLNIHTFGANYSEQDIPIEITSEIAKAISVNEYIPAARIDIGTLALEWLEEKDSSKNIDEFLVNKFNDFPNSSHADLSPKDIVLYGFGRIGRLVTRRIVTTTGRGEQLRLKAIVLRPKLKDQYQETKKRASLLETDSVHGMFKGTIDVSIDGSEMIINGNRIQMIYSGSPEDIDYTQYGINDGLVIDNTGVFRNKKELSRHLRPGISQVMLTAPGDDISNVVYGVNHEELDLENEKILSAASCTTNAIVPIIKVIDTKLGIEKGHIETVHSYTSDQNLLDNFHKKPRRGRGAATNMVLTSTGAAKAVTKVFPHMKGKLTGNAVRVPTPNVSLVILNLTLNAPTDLITVNAMLKDAALNGKLVEQIQYSTSTEFVSSHAVGVFATCVFDAPSTIVSEDGKTVTLYAWYDNEFGYSCQVVRLAKHVAKVRRVVYY
ncbi:glyceraldehyde-3-phosphate dehydrogenase [bacterium]|nr:glyceraldehyde-3-phosphate dehydrogenase [Saprospiraceae bacterium]MDC3253753.1 glyceraldehyde-3-phosphate dehydrogenase [bacterium]MDG1434082.1 glyceraldehyde-3-phosphate dehydrogenase [Saprospiraceae bacterium]